MFGKLQINYRRFRGALRSKNRAAYLGIGIRAAAPVTRILDWILFLISKRNFEVDVSKITCIFIVCPPRSGGTLIYQALNRTLPSVYISNLHAMLPKSASRIIRSSEVKLSKNKIANYYGYTSSIFDVYEGNEFFKWLHKDYSEIGQNKPEIEEGNKFLKLIKSLEPQPNECVIFKNTRAYSAIHKIYEAYPATIFVRVRRDPSQVIESVVRAYYDLGYFHPIPDSLKGRNITDPVKFGCLQIDRIEKSLEEQLSKIKTDQKFEIQYETFCEKPYEIIKSLAYGVMGLPAGSITELPFLKNLNPSTRKKVSEADRKKIAEYLITK